MKNQFLSLLHTGEITFQILHREVQKDPKMFHLSQEPLSACCRYLGLGFCEAAMSLLGICHTWQLIISHFYILLFLSFWWLELSTISFRSLPSGKKRCPTFSSGLSCRGTEGPFGSWKSCFTTLWWRGRQGFASKGMPRLCRKRRLNCPPLLAMTACGNIRSSPRGGHACSQAPSSLGISWKGGAGGLLPALAARRKEHWWVEATLHC